nr:tetratricopeptide repeat protein [Pseudomonadota bacterium]
MRFRILSHSVAAGLISLALAACSSPEEKEARYLKRGNDLFDKGQYDAARVEYKNAARLKPTDPEPPYRLGLIEEEQGNIRGAFVDFSHAEQQSAAYHPAILKIAEYYIAAEQYDEAQKRLDIVQHDTPEDPQAHALHAAILLRQKNLGDAETEAKGALAKDPINVTAYSVLTGVYNNEGDLAKANATLDEGIQHNPNDLSLLLLKARVNERTKDVPKIVEAYQTIFRLKPQEIRFRLDLATLYLKAGMTDDAEATLRAGVAAMPDNWDMKRQLVSFLGDQRSMEVAEKEVHGYMEAHPEKDDLYTWLIDIYVRHNTLDRANALLEQIIAQNRFDKQGMNARTALARVNYIKGDKEGAAKLINSVLEKDPNNPDALFMKSRMLVDKGLYRDAISDLRSILRDQPKSKEALQLLAEALFLQGHIDLAIDTLNQLLELDPTNTAARVRTAQLYHMNGDSKHAMDLLFLITKSEPGYAVAWESTARIAIDTKDWTTATTAIGTLDKLEGQHLTAVFLRAQLAANTGKPADAIPLYTQIISANPNSALGERALPALVTVYKGLNKMDDAVHYIESLKNDSPFVNTVLGE